jgi:hypothetical protein
MLAGEFDRERARQAQFEEVARKLGAAPEA